VQSHPSARDDILPAIARARTAAEQILRLAPTGRSLIRSPQRPSQPVN
jgi:hypothetical protein